MLSKFFRRRPKKGDSVASLDVQALARMDHAWATLECLGGDVSWSPDGRPTIIPPGSGGGGSDPVEIDPDEPGGGGEENPGEDEDCDQNDHPGDEDYDTGTEEDDEDDAHPGDDITDGGYGDDDQDDNDHPGFDDCYTTR